MKGQFYTLFIVSFNKKFLTVWPHLEILWGHVFQASGSLWQTRPSQPPLTVLCGPLWGVAVEVEGDVQCVRRSTLNLMGRGLLVETWGWCGALFLQDPYSAFSSLPSALAELDTSIKGSCPCAKGT